MNTKKSAPDFDWSLINTFLAALEAGSLLGAARRLGCSQPTVGRQLAALELQLGTLLFERTARGLVPTAAAARLVEAAQRMRAGADDLARQVQASRVELRGSVRISASQPVAVWLLPALLRRLRQALPEIEVELVASNAQSNLLRREADIALRMVRPVQSSLIARRIGTLAIGAFAHQDYLRRCGEPQRPADLLRHEVLGDDRGDAIRRGYGRLGLDDAAQRFALRTDDLVVYWEALRAGLGIGFVAAFVARTDPQVRAVLPGLALPALPIWLTVHREIRGSPPIRAVYDFLADAVPAALA